MKLSIYVFYCSVMATVANAGVGSLRGGPREQHSSVLRELLLGGGVKDIGAEKSNALKKALMPKKNIKEKKVKIPNLSSIVKNETKKVQEKMDKVETDKKKEKLPIKQVKPMLEKKEKIPVKPISPKRNGPANVDKDDIPSGVNTPAEDKENDESAGPPAGQPKDDKDEDKEVVEEEDTSSADDEKKESTPKPPGQSKDEEDEDADADAPKEVDDAPEEEKETPSTPGEGPSSPTKDEEKREVKPDA